MMKKKKGKTIETEKNGETLILPEELIQHIQSLMSGKEAARSTLLSKSWYAAWLTRPTIDFDEHDFAQKSSGAFKEFAQKTMQRFPCLKDLTLHGCKGCTRIHIATTSLQTISLEPKCPSDRAKFDVPNIRKFTYSASGLPSHLSINGASSWEWELNISIFCVSFQKSSWFMNLKKALKKFRLSRISLFIDLCIADRTTECEHEVDVEVSPNPLVVENLMIHAPPTFCCALLVRSFGAFRPKFVTHRDWPKYPGVLDKVKSVRERLIQLLFVSNGQEKFGRFNLKKVNMEIYDMFDTEWRPFQLKKPMADSKAKVRLQLIWED